MGVWVLQNNELPDVETCQGLLNRILSSPQLKRSARMRALLAYVGQRALEEGCEQLHEQEIGTEVFGRAPGYDTSTDNIVRVNATELRKRIESYFETEGLNEPLTVEIPRGSYIPVFRYRPVESPMMPAPPAPVADAPALVDEPEPEAPVPARQAALRPRPSGWVAGAIAAAVAIVALSIGCLHLWMQNRAMHKLLYPWEYKPAVAELWSGFLSANPKTDVVLADSGFGMFQTLSGQSFSLQDYLNRSYVNQLPDLNVAPDMRSTLHMLARRTLVSRGGFTMAQHLAALEPLGNKIHMYFSRNYMPSLIKRDNVVLFGTRLSNPWMEIYESRLNFVLQRNPNVRNPNARGAPRLIVTDRSPHAGEQAVYTPSGTSGYCTVAYLPNEQHTGRVMLIEGTTSEAAQGCGDFLLSEAEMSNLKKKFGPNGFPYFQVLLRTSDLIDMPITSTLVAYRSFQNPH